MNNNFIPLIGSEIALSLYPQLIKLIPSTIEIQVATRCITYSILAIIGYYITIQNNNKYTPSTLLSTLLSTPLSTTLSTLSSTTITTSLIMGIVNIIHITSSYICFNTLSSGVGYSIFYIYPIFNLLGRTFLYNEKIDIINYLYISIAIIGVYLNYKQTNKKNNNPDTNLDTKYTFINVNDILNTKNTNIGIVAGIVSALSESIIYFMVKDNLVGVSPFVQLLKIYLLGGILSIIYLIQNIKTNLNLDYHYWITLILFNAIVGFIGHLLRFIMIPKLSTLLFNSLIFTGVIFSYIWGYILSKEPITYSNVSGTLLILSSIFLINKK